MGELHLDIYVERIRREYKVEVEVGQPRVNYREAPTQKAEFNVKHRKQSGGSGQYAHIVGFMEPLSDEVEENFTFEEKWSAAAFRRNIFPRSKRASARC